MHEYDTLFCQRLILQGLGTMNAPSLFTMTSKRCLLLPMFLFAVQGTRNQIETMLTRKTDFLTDYRTVTHMINYRNEKSEAKDRVERKTRQSARRERTYRKRKGLNNNNK